MEIHTALSLIDHPIETKTATWADLGCGKGTFTEALGNLLPQNSRIFAIDRTKADLRLIPDQIAGCIIDKQVLDFENAPLPVPNLDGILMANSLHFVKHKDRFLRKITHYLKKEGCLIIVEYGRIWANPWVPFPISFSQLRTLLRAAGFNSIRKLNEVRSRYGSTIYSCFSVTVRRKKNHSSLKRGSEPQ